MPVCTARSAAERANGQRLSTLVMSGEDLVKQAKAKGEEQPVLIATLTGQLSSKQDELSAAKGRIASFEAQVATLLSQRDTARGQAADLTAKVAGLMSEKDALQLALAKARDEIDAGAEAARLAAARREALEALVANRFGEEY